MGDRRIEREREGRGTEVGREDADWKESISRETEKQSELSHLT